MRFINITAFLWFSGFCSSLYFWNDLQLIHFTVAIIFTTIWAVFTLNQQVIDGFSVPRSWFLRLTGLFWLLVLLSLFWSEVKTVSLMGFCFFSVLPLTLYGFIIHGTAHKDDVYRCFSWIGSALAIAFAGLAIWAMIQFFIFNDYYEGHASSPLANSNSLGALLSLGLFSALGWMMLASRKIHAVLACVLAVLLIGGVMSTGSRGAFFAAIPALLMIAIWGRSFVKQNWSGFVAILAAASAFFLLTSMGDNKSAQIVTRVGKTITGGYDDPLQNRENIWRSTWAIIQDHWLTGTGIGTFFLYYPSYRLPTDEQGAVMAHSDPLQYWAELGILGPILFYSVLIAALWRTVIALGRAATDDPQRIRILVPFCALGAMIIHTHVSFNLYNLPILFIAGLLLAWWFLETQKILGGRVIVMTFPEGLPVWLRKSLITAIFIFPVFFFTAFSASEYYNNKARTAAFAGDFDSYYAYLNRAQKLGFGMSYRAQLLDASILVSVLDSQSDMRLPAPQRKIFYGQAVYALERAQQLNARSAAVHFYRGKLHAHTPEDSEPPDLPEPQTSYQKALELDKAHLGARLALIQIAKEAEDKETLRQLIQEGLDYKYHTTLAEQLYSEAILYYATNGDFDNQQKALKKLFQFKKRSEESKNRQTGPFADKILSSENI